MKVVLSQKQGGVFIMIMELLLCYCSLLRFEKTTVVLFLCYTEARRSF